MVCFARSSSITFKSTFKSNLLVQKGIIRERERERERKELFDQYEILL